MLSMDMNCLRQIDPIDVLHDNEVLIFDASEVMHTNNIVVLKLAQKTCFGNELADEILVQREPAMKPLEGHHCPEAFISAALCEEYLCHASFANLAKEIELATNYGKVGHVVMPSK